MARPMPMLDLTELENFRRMCVQDLKILELSHCSLEKDEMAQRQILMLFYAFHRYFRADPDSVTALREGDLLGNEEIAALSGIFRSAPDEDEPANPAISPIDILVALPRQNTRTATDLKKEIVGYYKTIANYLEGLKGIPTDEKRIERRLRMLGFRGVIGETCPITIRLLLHVCPTKAQRKTIMQGIDAFTENFSVHDPALRVCFGDEIDYEVRNTEARFQFVPQGTLSLDRADNHCDYQEGDHRAMFVNVRAASLRRLWQTCSTKGLLAQNLRYFVSLPRVDSAMSKTMLLAPKDFWYLNNGLTIVCDSFRITGKELTMRNFSIVNGGQTTHNIGTANELTHDFALPCKIIALEQHDGRPLPDDDRLDFIANVCTATNSQKPIKAADAVTNLREIRELRRHLKEDPLSPVYLVSKRGEKIDAALYPKPWNRVKVQALGQLLLAFVYQYPCTARNKTKELFENEALFNLLFNYRGADGQNRLPPAAFVRDLLLLGQAVKTFQNRWAKTTVRQGDSRSQQLRSLAANGGFLLIACVGVLCKLHTHEALREALRAPGACLDRKALGHCDIVFPFLAEHDIAALEDPDGDLQRLLAFCLGQVIAAGYADYCAREDKSSDYSNFAKADDRYLGYVQKRLLQMARDGLPDEEQARCGRLFRTPTQAERQALATMDAQHSIKWGAEHDEYVKDLICRLTVACKALDRKPRSKYPIPSKTTLRTIINRAPQTVATLNGIDGLSAEQVQAYGETLLRLLREAEGELGMPVGKVEENAAAEEEA